jgi:hypothetical protein
MKSNKKKYTHSLEEFLQDQAERFVMYPSDKVWNNVREELHPKKKWTALLILFLFITSTLSIVSLQFYPKKASDLAYTEQIYSNVELNTALKKTIPQSKKRTDKAREQREFKEKKSFLVEKKETSNVSNVPLITLTSDESNETYKLTSVDANVVIVPYKTETKNLVQVSSINNANKLKINEDAVAKSTSIPSKKATKKISKWNIQFYTTPSISYRVLEDDKLRNSFGASDLDNIDDFIYHKPSVGTEIGVGFLYAISKNLFVKTGVQFNMRKYEVEAYNNQGIATVTLVDNNQLVINNEQAKFSTKKLQNNSSVNLSNTMYQLSVPVGLQWNAINGEKWGLIAAASVQPTFSLNKTLYAVSTDYKYYVDGAKYARRGNLNTSFELLLSLKKANNTLFFGPQIRYQQMSTFKDIYPIKENRIDYGIKIGVMKSL